MIHYEQTRTAGPRKAAREHRVHRAWESSGLSRLLRTAGICRRRGDAGRLAVFLTLSLGAAVSGGIAAIGLAPLIKPSILQDGRTLLPFMWSDPYRQAVGFGLAMVTFALMRWQSARVSAALVASGAMRLRQLVHGRLTDAQLSSLSEAKSSEIANVLTYNSEILTQGFSALLQLATMVLTLIATVLFAVWISPILLLVLPPLALLTALAAHAYGREQSQVSRRYVNDMTRLFWFSEEFPRRLRHVRSFERQNCEKSSYGAIAAHLGDGYRRQLELVAAGRLLLELVGAAGIALTFLLARTRPEAQGASLIAVGLLLARLLPYLVSARQVFQQIRSAKPALDLWQHYMSLDPDEPLVEAVRTITADEALRIDYLRLRTPFGLEVRDIMLMPGKMTLITGNSGIGKTCLVDVLAGMVRPDAFIATMGTRPIDFEVYRALVKNGAYVGQGVRPWQSTVRECLLWAEPTASDETLLEALADVGLKQRLEAGDGLDTALDSSGRLSGGQMQRLLLAQVILRRPSLAILDEATGALDAESERAVLASLRQRLPHTMLVVVSHRAGLDLLANHELAISSR